MAGFFDDLFDFNHDGKLSGFESAAKWAAVAHIMKEPEETDGFEIFGSSVESSASVTDELRDLDLELAGLDKDELEWMDEDERRTALEDAGLDSDEYDF